MAASSCSGLGRLCWWTWRASANSGPRHNEGLRERTCSMDVPETNHHLFNVCPGWADIRTKRNHSASLDLPHCTQCTGVACLPPSTLTILKELAQTSVVLPDHTNFFSEVFPAFESVSNDVLSIWLCTHMMHPGHPYWKRCGFALIFDSLLASSYMC